MPLGAARTLPLRNDGNVKWGRCQVMTGATVFEHSTLSLQYATKAHCMPMTGVSGVSMPCIGLAKQNYATCAATALITAEYFWNCEAKFPLTACSAGMIGHVVYAAGDSLDKICGLRTCGNPVGILRALDGAFYGWVEVGVYPAYTYA